MKVQAKLYWPVHDTFVFIAYASSEGLDEPEHLRRSPQPLLLALKKRKDVDEGSGPTLPLLWGGFVVVDSFFNIHPIGLLGLRVWFLLSYALLGVLSNFAIILTNTRKHDDFNCLSTINVL